MKGDISSKPKLPNFSPCLHGVHPDLPDPLPQLRAVPATPQPEQEVPEYRHLEVELHQGLPRGRIIARTICRKRKKIFQEFFPFISWT